MYIFIFVHIFWYVDSLTCRLVYTFYISTFIFTWSVFSVDSIMLGCEVAPWALIQYKMSSYQYRKSHNGGTTILRPSYLHNEISYTGKSASLYWIGALDTCQDKPEYDKYLLAVLVWFRVVTDRFRRGYKYMQWTSYQIRKIAGCACAGNAGNVFPATDFKGNCYLAIPAWITARASRTCRDACRDR